MQDGFNGTEDYQASALYSLLHRIILPVLSIFGGYFLAYAAYCLWISPAPWPVVFLAVVTAVLFLLLRFVLHYRTVPLSWTDPIQAGCALLGLANLLLRFYYDARGQKVWEAGLVLTVDLGLLVIALGLVLLSNRWLTATAMVSVGGWGILVWRTGFSPDWMLVGRYFLVATAIALAVRFVRATTHRRFATLHEKLTRRSEELARTLAATEREVEERKSLTHALRQSEEKYRELFENASDLVYTMDLQGRFTSLNKAGEEVFGYSAEEICRRGMAELVDEEQRTRLRGLLQLKLEGCPRTDFEVPIAAKDGRRVWLDVSSRLIFRDAEPVGIHAIARDATARKEAELALRESENRYRTLVENSPGLICAHDAAGKILSVNQGTAESLGYSAQDLVGSSVTRVLAPRSREIFHQYLDHIRSHGVATGTMWLVTSSGEERAYLYRNVVVQEGGESAYILSHGQDVTQQRRAQRVLAAQRRVLEMVASGKGLQETMDALTEGVSRLLMGRPCAILLLDRETERLVRGAVYGLPEEVVGRLCEDVTEAAVACGGAVFGGETVVAADLDTDPRWRSLCDVTARYGLRACWAVPLLDKNGEALGTFAVWDTQSGRPTVEDLEVVQEAAKLAAIAIERHLSEIQNKRLAYQDSLTGLPNRLSFNQRLETALERARQGGETLAVLFLDLDRFKEINDTLGHSFGDELLRRVARRLLRSVAEGDTVARLGGDEFTLVLPGLSSRGDAEGVAERILEALRRPYHLADRELFITASLGISIYPECGSGVDALMMNADAALYRAKGLGRDTFQTYAPEMSASAIRSLSLDTQLRRALKEGELTLYYQPLVRPENNEIEAFEALLRWHHPSRGLVDPASFIPVIERTGLIISVGAWVLQAACSQLRAWYELGYSRLSMAVNLSARQLQSPHLPVQIARALDEAGIPGHALQLEITETHALENTELTISTLKALKELGVKVSIDDFGTGYSSLDYLKRLPIDSLKIDRTFVRDIACEAGDAAITRAVIAMAHALDLQVVAEGVESEAQRRFLTEQGCDLIQGYLIAAPQPAGEADELLTRLAGIEPPVRLTSVGGVERP